jgi:hypothetical protein
MPWCSREGIDAKGKLAATNGKDQERRRLAGETSQHDVDAHLRLNNVSMVLHYT